MRPRLHLVEGGAVGRLLRRDRPAVHIDYSPGAGRAVVTYRDGATAFYSFGDGRSALKDWLAEAYGVDVDDGRA